jgi:predicted Zn-dependent protease
VKIPSWKDSTYTQGPKHTAMSAVPTLRSPLGLVSALVLAGVIFTLFRNREPAPSGSTELPSYCQGLTEEECGRLGFDEFQGGGDSSDNTTSVLAARDVCVSVGYLCAEVETAGELRVLRWPRNTPTLRVWIPEPEHLSGATAREFQRAAVRGIQVWHNHPFPLTISTRATGENPDITLEWVSSLGGNRLGEAQKEWSKVGSEVRVKIPSLSLVTHHPSNPKIELTPDQILLVAAHEMGHALGLPHSDNERDLMYPMNTAWRPTSRDYRTMEAVYQTPNGALIRR